MLTSQFRLLFCALFFISFADAGHIKRHHFQARSECRARLVSNETDSGLYGHLHGQHTHPVVATSSRTSSTNLQHSTTPASTRARVTTSLVATTSTQATSTVHPPSTSETLAPSVKAPESAVVIPLAASFVPNNNKAGIAGGDAYSFMVDHIGWWYDWSPNPSKPGKPVAVPMLWGNGTAGQQDAQRLKAFEQITNDPPYVLGFEEPDCPTGSGSAGMSVKDGVSKWEALIAPMKAKGTRLGSPSMCKQADETWLAQFAKAITTPWDFTAIHINKNSLDGVKKDMAHYETYGKPIWVTEFACVDDNKKFEPCTDQSEINAFINDVVDYFEGNSNVFAYAYSNGLGLGDVWPLMKGNSLSKSGQTYLNALKKYH
ncbi:hypothetical protein D9619_004571 [Psilocybe cf. subviscida]|uniref:Asl1-like glycosyl hydrolase catalytic domain-containing protein n=1 Tax=Psilocybe cf. subviscida TaxID=2480587 RepID=A0A8H5F8M3_9AGAR|nr:hypothetical protein D9619_004571 [Psilocybe cf. subviscida]